MKTSELTGPALDWAVAKCEGYWISNKVGNAPIIENPYPIENPLNQFIPFHPSRSWVQGGPIIEEERIDLIGNDKYWTAYINNDIAHCVPLVFEHGKTPLIAAMRCYVASKLGDAIEIPEELL
jgi:hypothetical protein